MSFLLKRRSYWADIASDATNEQSDTIVCQHRQQTNINSDGVKFKNTAEMTFITLNF